MCVCVGVPNINQLLLKHTHIPLYLKSKYIIPRRLQREKEAESVVGDEPIFHASTSTGETAPGEPVKLSELLFRSTPNPAAVSYLAGPLCSEREKMMKLRLGRYGARTGSLVDTANTLVADGHGNMDSETDRAGCVCVCV